MTILSNLIDKIQKGCTLDEQEEMLAEMTLEVIFNLQIVKWTNQ
jgi:hypothetical protein